MLRLALIDGTREQVELAAQAVSRLRQVRLLINAALDHVDGVWIAGPLAQRAELALRAAQAGKHVLIESPWTDSITAADRIIQACAAAGVKLMLSSSLRYRPSIAAVKAALDSGKLGQTALLRVHSWQPPTADQPADLQPLIVQHLDLAAWMFRASPTEIFAQGRPAEGDRRWPDYVQLHLGFPDGGMALISLAQGLPDGDDYDSLSVVGSTGAAYADDHYQTHLLYRGEAPRAVKSDESLMTVAAQLREFVTAIAANREPASSGADGITALRLAEAAQQSLSAGQPVCLQEGRYVIAR